MGASGISVPSGSPGAQADAMAQVREAIKILEQALPKLQTGTDPYKSVLSAIQSISKHVSPSAEVPGVQQTALRDLQQSAGKNAALEQVMRSLGGAGAGAGAGGGQPPMAPAGGPGM